MEQKTPVEDRPGENLSIQKVLDAVGMKEGLASDEVARRAVLGSRLGDAGQRIMAFYLVELSERRLESICGFPTLRMFARERLGLAERRYYELFHAGKRLRELTAIDAAFCAQRIGWSKVLLLVRVATQEHEASWIERAEVLNCEQLELEVQRVKHGEAPRQPGDKRGLSQSRFPLRTTLSKIVYEKLELGLKKLSAERGEAVSLPEFLEDVVDLWLSVEDDGTVPGRQLLEQDLYQVHLREDEDGDLVVDTDLGPIPLEEGEVLDPPTPRPLRLQILARDGHRCRCCGSRHRLQVHHIVWRGKRGRTVAANLIVACRRCHGLIHEGLLVLKGPHALDITFTDREGRPLQATDGYVPAAELLVLRPPVQPEAVQPEAVQPEAGPESAEPVPTSALALATVTTLATVPAVIDGTWWAAHAHRFTPRGRGEFELQPGAPSPQDRTPDAVDPDCGHPQSDEGAPDRGYPQSGEGDPACGHPQSGEGDPACGHPQSGESAPACGHPQSGEGDPACGYPQSGEGDPACGHPQSGESAPACGYPQSGHALVGLQGRVRLLEETAQGSQARGRPFPHTLFVGPPGMGKTTLAEGVARAYGTRLHRTSGPLLQEPRTLVQLLAGLQERDMLLLDEIHAAAQPVLVTLYEAMAERQLSFQVSSGSSTRTVTLKLPAFTVLAATTEEQQLRRPLKDRFGLLERLGPYPVSALADLAVQRAKGQGVELAADGAEQLARIARGTPRELLRLLERVLDVAAVRGTKAVEREDMAPVLARLGYDERGLTPVEQRYLALLDAAPGPLSLQRLATFLRADPRVVTDEIEPYLFERDLVRCTRRGRVRGPGLTLVA